METGNLLQRKLNCSVTHMSIILSDYKKEKRKLLWECQQGIAYAKPLVKGQTTLYIQLDPNNNLLDPRKHSDEGLIQKVD